VVLVEDSEGIVQVKVRFKGQSNFGGLEFSFKSDKVSKAINKLVFLMDVQNGTAHWTASNWTANAGGRAASVAASYWAASSRTATDWTASYGTVSNWAASDGAVASRTASDW